MGTSIPEPAPTAGSGPDLWPQVIQRHHGEPAFTRAAVERHRFGVEKYGRGLKAYNGRNAIVDALQEALDLVVYLEQVKCEATDGWTTAKACEMQAKAVDMANTLALMVGA